MTSAAKIKLGISSCLLGNAVRYDGGAKEMAFLRDRAGERVAWVPVCPEVEFGLPVPREKITLRPGRNGGPPELWTLDGRRDLTAEMREFCRERAKLLGRAGLRGFVFKGRSPSCALGTAPLRLPGAPGEEGADSGLFADGFFAAAWTGLFPGLPAVEAESLAAPGAFAAFLRSLNP